MIQLICEGGRLHTPRSVITDPLLLAHLSDNPLLLRIYDAGDCDSIKWPNPDADNLRGALYDARETGVLPAHTQSVLLPDGTEFVIDEICKVWTPMIRDDGGETKSCKFCGLIERTHHKEV